MKNLKTNVVKEINISIAIFSSLIYFSFILKKTLSDSLFSFGTGKYCGFYLGDFLIIILFGFLLILNVIQLIIYKEGKFKITFLLWLILSCWLLFYTLNKSMFPFFILRE